MLESKGSNWRWPTSPEEVDSDLFRDVNLSSTQVLASAFDAQTQTVLRSEIQRFLGEIAPTGPVLIKPSAAGSRSPDHDVSAALLELVIEAVCAVFPASRIWVGDGPVYTRFEDESERLGWAAVCRRFGVQMIDLNGGEVQSILNRWPVAASFLHSAGIINLCKAKTHRRFGVSLGLKSLLGTLAGRILGSPKLSGCHRAVPRLLNYLAEVAPPTLTVIDGVNGIEDNGPFSGTRSPSRFFCVGRGYYGPDVRATVEMGFDPALIPYFLRPRTGGDGGESVPRWHNLRQTEVDFFPAKSARWLYRSLKEPKARQSVFPMLLEEVRLGWTSSELFPEVAPAK